MNARRFGMAGVSRCYAPVDDGVDWDGDTIEPGARESLHAYASLILFCAIRKNSSFASMPMNDRPVCFAATPVLPLPMNGSNTVPPSGQYVRMR